nr:MAG TPA: hypothetical protein [Caudoviricetes sp.]
MAKTLIGNIKGKDGRGISKIEKTATTGVVDTYTITYTDGTKSTYEVKNSDNVAIQRQIVPSAAVESSTTASQAYTAGDYVVVGGVLRKVTSSITKGSTIGNSNSTATTVTGEIEAVRDSVSRAIILYSNGGWTIAVKSGIVFVRVNNIKLGSTSPWAWKDCPYTIPEQYRPSGDIIAAAARDNGGGSPIIQVTAVGNVQIGNRGGTSSDDAIFGALCYPVGV